MPGVDTELTERQGLVHLLPGGDRGGGDATGPTGRGYVAAAIAVCAAMPARPLYLWLTPAEEFGGAGSSDPQMGPYLMQKVIPVAESPRRWPRAAAGALTTWEP